MKNKKGFIATSLIYSFFLVFIAIMMALLNNFIANKTVQEKFNDDVREALDNKRYTVTLYGYNTNIQDGATLSNLINDGEFEHGTTYWLKEGLSNIGTTLCDSSTSTNCFKTSNAGYVYQEVLVEKENKYYYSVKYRNNTGATQNVYLDNTTDSLIAIDTNKSIWTSVSSIYTSNKNGSVRMVVGHGVGVLEITDVMLINLTASFGKGNEPTKEWMDANIEYFNGTVSYLRLDKIQAGKGIQVKFSPYKKDAISTVKCTPTITTNMITNNYKPDNTSSGDDRTYADFSIDSVTQDISCNVRWE